MQIQFFDVTHGFCAYLIADNGNVMLFDCGHNERTGFRPSKYLPENGCTEIESLIIQNFDQDHVSDLPNLLSRLPVTSLMRNRGISPEQLYSLKRQSGPITSAMDSAISMHREYVHPIESPPVFPNVEHTTFCNDYPAFEDTNNLSLVSFIECDGLGIVLPGDLETTGWMSLLNNASFRNHLAKVNVFVASHHGRTSGYCEKVFDYCKPEIVIISDKEVTHETQVNCYAKHATGIPWDGGPDRRYVLTTRSDGMITIQKILGKGYHVTKGS